jgi:hypothetical protein
VGFETVAQRLALVDPVTVATSLLRHGEKTGILHVANDLLNRPFRDAYLEGDVTEPYSTVSRQADQHVTVVAEKSPITHHKS